MSPCSARSLDSSKTWLTRPWSRMAMMWPPCDVAMPADSCPRCWSAYSAKYARRETSRPGATMPKTPHSSRGPSRSSRKGSEEGTRVRCSGIGPCPTRLATGPAASPPRVICAHQDYRKDRSGMSIPLPFRQAGLVAAALVGSCLAAAPASAASIWTEVPSGTTQNITAIEYQSASRFWFTTAAGAIFKRQTDGSFAQVKTPSGVPLNDIEFSSGQIGFAVGNGGQVLRSTDGGNTWNPIPPKFASATDSTFMDCKQTKPLGDVNSVRFAGDNRVWI